MRLLLTSAGLANNSIVSALKELAEKPFEKLNLAFIPTAANLEKGEKPWVIKDLSRLKELGFKLEIVDIEKQPEEEWMKKLEAADVLFFEGGNSYHLNYWLKKSGLDKLLTELLRKRVYIGTSAGSNVATPSIALSPQDKKLAAEKEDGEISDRGLGLVGFLIKPHLNSPHFLERTLEFIEEQSKTVSLPVYAIDDQTAIKVDGSSVTVVSEGEWKKFN